MLFILIYNLFLPLLQFSANPNVQQTSRNPFKFELRHLHAVSPDARVVFADVIHPQPQAVSLNSLTSFELRSVPITTYKPPSFGHVSRARLRSLRYAQSEALSWDEDTVLGPDVESRETLLTLAKMTNNAYVPPDDPAWYDLGSNWTSSYPFGWEPDADGFRGHVFATPDNSTVVVSIKGTSPDGLFVGGGPTAKKDKMNDNLLFSCCCARIDWTWTTVCGCYRGGWKCDQDCVEQSLVNDSLFYPIGTNLYNNLTYMYPDANIWLTGHSLGGSLAALLGVTFGAPVVAFEAPGEKRAAQRLHLPSPPSIQHVTHVYHTADPIPMGTCTGILSTCSLGGYALETRCHLGKTILYDTISHLSWSADVRTHGIVRVIEEILSKDWQPSVEKGREVPESAYEDDCTECYSWEYGSFASEEALQAGSQEG